MVTGNFRWGIIGGRRISSKFAIGLKSLPNTKISAVASRSGEINSNIEAEKIYRNYQELIEDPEVDIVYIGNINPQHHECIELCLRAGKPVLCEKPVTMNARECRELIQLSKETNTFFMEAMWTRFLPVNKRLTEICKNQEYGKVKFIQISFGDYSDISEKRLFSPELGGGGLLDLGVYCVNYVNMLLDEHPSKIRAWANKTDKTMDLLTSMQLEYPSGCVADLHCSIDRQLRNEAFIVAENGEFTVPFFWRPEHFFRFEPNKPFQIPQPVEDYFVPLESNGYSYEAVEVMECLERGDIESSIMSHADSLAIMETLDEIRKQCGIKHPTD